MCWLLRMNVLVVHFNKLQYWTPHTHTHSWAEPPTHTEVHAQAPVSPHNTPFTSLMTTVIFLRYLYIFKEKSFGVNKLALYQYSIDLCDFVWFFSFFLFLQQLLWNFHKTNEFLCFSFEPWKYTACTTASPSHSHWQPEVQVSTGRFAQSCVRFLSWESACPVGAS